jgi:hypothetical protein
MLQNSAQGSENLLNPVIFCHRQTSAASGAIADYSPTSVANIGGIPRPFLGPYWTTS